MKSPLREEMEEEKEREDGDEGEFSPQPRRLPSMIPARYKLKEERRKVLKISTNKLKKIEDPESWLCRSVLINNTMKKLQREMREEKLQKQMSLYNKDCLLDYQLNNNNPKDMDNFVYDKPTKMRKLNKIESSITTNGVSLNEDVVEKIPSIKRCASRKRSVDEDSRPPIQEEEPPPAASDDMDDCDVHDVLSQLYMPPTPRLITSIDSDTDEDDLNVVDIDSNFIEQANPSGAQQQQQQQPPPNKKPKLEIFEDFLCSDQTKEQERTCSVVREEDEEIELEDEEDIKRRLSHSLSNQLNFRKNEAFFDDATTGLDACESLYSCGHASLFGDLQTVTTFHNLIASLET